MPKASRTAVLVCQARAVADGRLAIGRFSDPIAHRLLDDHERSVVDMARRPTPGSWRDRPTHTFIAATAEILATRTVSIDDAVREAGHRQLVILGAGLDGRAWRMDSLARTEVFEVDQQASQSEKRRRVAEAPPVASGVTFVPVEFGVDNLDAALAAAGHRAEAPTTWVWEGVLPYLTDGEVATTLRDIATRSAPGSRLIASYPRRRVVNRWAHHALRLIFAVTGHSNPMAHERHIASWEPTEMRDLLARYDLVVTADRDQRSIAEELNIDSIRPEGLANGRVVVADVPTS